MITIREAGSQGGAYTQRGREIDLKAFFDGMKVNFKRQLILYFDDMKYEDLIVTADPSHVKISASGITIENENTDLIYILNFKAIDLGLLYEERNGSVVDYILPLNKYKRMYYRVKVR